MDDQLSAKYFFTYLIKLEFLLFFPLEVTVADAGFSCSFHTANAWLVLLLWFTSLVVEPPGRGVRAVWVV